MNSSTERHPRWLIGLFLSALLALLALTAWQWRDGAPVSASLLDLLPSSAPDALEQRAELRMQEPLERDLVLLIQHPDSARARQLAAELGTELDASGLYRQVRWDTRQDLAPLRRQLLDGRLALLGAADRERLIQAPQAYLEERVQALFEPFAGTTLVPAEQDWLGLASRIQQHLPKPGNTSVDASGALVAEHAGRSWALLHLSSAGSAFEQDLPLEVAQQVERARERIEAAGGTLLATGGPLYAAHGQQQARAESSLIGGLSLVASLALLLLLFRTPRILLSALPVGVGVLAGAAACVALFGQIHVLTLVLGASLIGVTLDFPLHYLSKSWALQPWQPTHALRLTLPGMSLALVTNLIGYLALAFTPFPGLTQVALFSAAGLLGAYLCAVCLLPALTTRLQPWPAPLGLAQRWLALLDALRRRVATPWLLGLLALFCLGGVLQLSFKDDLRQWIAKAPQLTEQARQIGEITGFQPTSQFFLVRAADQDQLLQRQAAVSQRLDALVQDGSLAGYQSLSQLIAPRAEQQRLRDALGRLAAFGQPLQALGVSEDALAAEIEALQALPLLDIDAVLAGPLGEAWRPLWLGADAGQVAGIISLRGLTDSSTLAGLADGIEGVTLVDRLAQLNQLFAETQLKAAELKLAACGLILLVLLVPFGLGGGARVLAVPLLAALASLASLGWLGQPLTLFGLFGLLLVTAIGVDYAILMRERIGGAAVSLLGTALAAVTTWLSFGLLALSSTPAVANFGLAISLGLVFAFLFAPWAGDAREHAS